MKTEKFIISNIVALPLFCIMNNLKTGPTFFLFVYFFSFLILAEGLHKSFPDYGL